MRDTGLKKVLAQRVLALSIVFVVSLTSISGVLFDNISGLKVSGSTEQANLVDIEEVSIPGGPAGHVEVQIIRPSGNTEALPVIMYFHGGGWMGGNKYTHAKLISKLANKANAAVVFVEYSLTPEVKYPFANEEAYHALEFISENGKKFNLDSSRLAVAGDSAGGNMATVMTIMAKQRKGPKISYQVLFYPVTDANFDTASYHEFASGYHLDRDTMKWIWDNYLPDEEARKEPTASPLQAPTDLLKDLPPALIITAEHDVLRDEGEAYARKLSDAGVPATGIQYLGMVHGFMLHDAFTDTPATREAIDLAGEKLREAFAR